jgi:hypothetical protein
MICLIVALISSIYILDVFWPKYGDVFFEIGLLGANKKAEGYFLDDNSTLNEGTSVSWFITINNRMESPQNIVVKVKLLSVEMQGPNASSNVPSPTSPFFEMPLTLSVDELVVIPFSWKITNIISYNETVAITSLLINEVSVEVFAASYASSRYRMVFELWVYNHDVEEYMFGWESRDKFFSAFVYIWFDVVIPEL